MNKYSEGEILEELFKRHISRRDYSRKPLESMTEQELLDELEKLNNPSKTTTDYENKT